MSRIFRDAVTPHLIPMIGLDGVFAYANGHYAWPEAEAERFRKAGKQVAHIDVNGTGWRLARILDVERFDATPEDAAEWIPLRNKFRQDATIYHSRAGLPDLFAVTRGLKYSLIVADWTGRPHRVTDEMPEGVTNVGTQYVNTRNWDATVIYDDAWLKA